MFLDIEHSLFSTRQSIIWLTNNSLIENIDLNMINPNFWSKWLTKQYSFSTIPYQSYQRELIISIDQIYYLESTVHLEKNTSFVNQPIQNQRSTNFYTQLENEPSFHYTTLHLEILETILSSSLWRTLHYKTVFEKKSIHMRSDDWRFNWKKRAKDMLPF